MLLGIQVDDEGLEGELAKWNVGHEKAAGRGLKQQLVLFLELVQHAYLVASSSFCSSSSIW